MSERLLQKGGKISNESSRVVNNGFHYMSLEYCPFGDLFDLVSNSGKLNISLAKTIFLQLLDGVEYLHTQSKLAHLDLKLENVLISNDFTFKLCDFGFVEPLLIKVTKNKGTDGYKSPEIYQMASSGFDGDKADIFALGVILFIMIFGVPPFTMATKDNPYYRLFYRGSDSARFFFRMHPATRSLYQNGEINPQLMDLLMTLMDENPANRPRNINEIRQHPFFMN